LGVFCFLISLNQVLGQNFEFKPIKAEGEYPEQIELNFLYKYHQNAENESPNETQNLYLLQSYFEIENIISSGKVVYGNKLCEYIEKIANEVPKNSPL